MSPRQFYAANILSALAWAPAHVFPGVLFGMAIRLAGASAERLTLLIISGLIVVSATCWFLPRARGQIATARANRLRLTCFSNSPELQ
jgi:membrane protein DedA with SNARE-associated domain